tara:strand:- start:935 stop:1699 length:765 start_codon:yes stop_codon:yes gene_type:complete
MADTYEINDPTPSEQITLEEEAENIPDKPADDGRPEWLPEKFKSPEDLARAYNSLEAKLGSNQEPSEAEDLPPTEPSGESEGSESQTSAIQAASAEWSETGELSDMTYDALQKVGLSKELVDSYIEGQQALHSTAEAELMDVVGGKEAYNRMAEWASESLSETQLDAYNKAVETGTEQQAKLALDWLKGKYEADNGTNPALILGKTQGSSSAPFESRAQVLAAMAERDATGRKKYEVDPAYRTEVERRLAISNI